MIFVYIIFAVFLNTAVTAAWNTYALKKAQKLQMQWLGLDDDFDERADEALNLDKNN